MTDPRQPNWWDPITVLHEFRDLSTRIERPFANFPRPEGRLYAVLGGFKMGKTSLLNVLPQWLRQQGAHWGQLLVPAPIRYDSTEADLASPQAFLLRLLIGLREGLRAIGLATISERRLEPYFRQQTPAEGFRDAFAFVLQQARRALSSGRDPLRDFRLIGLADDAEEIAGLPWADELFRDLRDLYAREELVRHRLDLILAGESRLARHFEDDAPWADGDRFYLPPMGADTVWSWLQEISEGQLPAEVTEAIVEESGGQPFLVRYFVHHLQDEAEGRSGWDRLDPRIVDRLARQFDTRHPDVSEAWVRSIQTTVDRAAIQPLCTLLLDAGNKGVSVYDVAEQLESQDIQINAERTLERLVWQGVARPVTGMPGRVAFTGVFRRYVEQLDGQIPLPAKIGTKPQALSRPVFDYDDFSLTLSSEGDGYRVEVQSHVGAASSVFHNPLSLDELQSMWQNVAREKGTSSEIEAIGGRLFRAVFRDETLSRFRSAWEWAQKESIGLRVKLILRPPELHGLPWELLFDQEILSFLSLRTYMPLIRYVERPTPVPEFEPIERLRLLVVAASPSDAVPLGVDRELENLERSLEPGLLAGWLEYDIVRSHEANADNLLRLLRQADYHVFHFLGHGESDPISGEGVLFLEREDGTSEPLNAHQLEQLFQDARGLRLAFLNAWMTAVPAGSAPFTSVAGALVRAGVPAVVATQYGITDRAASRFSYEFYRALAEGHPVEAAMAEGRKAIFFNPGSYEWAVPVLYLRAEHGHIFPSFEMVEQQLVPAVSEIEVVLDLPTDTVHVGNVLHVDFLVSRGTTRTSGLTVFATADLSLRAQPRITSPQVGSATSGQPLTVVEEDVIGARASVGQEGQWIQVQTAAGELAWASAGYLCLTQPTQASNRITLQALSVDTELSVSPSASDVEIDPDVATISLDELVAAESRTVAFRLTPLRSGLATVEVDLALDGVRQGTLAARIDVTEPPFVFSVDNAYALIVGVANYQAINPLPPTVLKDAQDIHDTLIDPGYCGYRRENVQLLLDQAATGDAIRQALRDLATRSDSDSSVFLYFSVHCGRLESGSHAGQYIFPVDADTFSDKAIAQSAISGQELAAALGAIPAAKMTIVFDGDHSGGIGQPKDPTVPTLVSGLSASFYDTLTIGGGRVVLTSSQSGEVSWVLPGAENSIFAGCLLEAMRGGVAGENGLVHIVDLFEYIGSCVTREQPNQHPEFFGNIGDNFAIGLHRGGRVQAAEANIPYTVSIHAEPDVVPVGGGTTITVELEPFGLDSQADTLTVPGYETDLGIFIHVPPGFQCLGPDAISLPLERAESVSLATQRASFRLRATGAIPQGTTEAQLEFLTRSGVQARLPLTLYTREADLEALLRHRTLFVPRPVSQPDAILRVQPIPDPSGATVTLYYLLEGAETNDGGARAYHSRPLARAWSQQVQRQLAEAVTRGAGAAPEEQYARLALLGQELAYQLCPADLWQAITADGMYTLLVLSPDDAWLPWELLHDGSEFLAERLIVGRWPWKLNDLRPYEFPVGEIRIAHFEGFDRPDVWERLLQPLNAPQTRLLPRGTLETIKGIHSLQGLHLLRRGRAPGRVVESLPIPQASPEKDAQGDGAEVQTEGQADDAQDLDRLKLPLRGYRPVVSFGYLDAGAPDLTGIERTWATAFVSSGASAFVGPLWTVVPAAEAAFLRGFYDGLWTGSPLGEAFRRGRRLARAAVPESLDWLAYVLFGDPMARAYLPVRGEGYAVVEAVGREIDEPVTPGDTVRYRVSLQRTPPVWHTDRLVEVAEELSFAALEAHVATFGLLATPEVVPMRKLGKDYRGWFQLHTPERTVRRSTGVQIRLMDGDRPVHTLSFSVYLATAASEDGEA